MKKKPIEKSSLTREEKIDQVCLELSKYIISNNIELTDIWIIPETRTNLDNYIYVSKSGTIDCLDLYQSSKFKVVNEDIKRIIDEFIHRHTLHIRQPRLFRKDTYREMYINVLDNVFGEHFDKFYAQAIKEVVEEMQKNEFEAIDKEIKNIKNILQQSN